MTRQGRLESAKATCWVEKYDGKNLIKGYAKLFAVDLLCAVAELRLLGVEISQEREKQLRGTVEARTADRGNESDMLEEYDFSAGVRDKYVERFDVPSDEENLRLWVVEAERRLEIFALVK